MTALVVESDSGRELVVHEKWVLCAAVITTGMAFIDATALNVALPAIQTELKSTGAEVLWVINAYGLFVAALLLAAGAVGDRCGRVRVYLGGIVLFAIASIACGFAPNTRALIAARGLQGIGGAFMIPGSLAMITATAPSNRRGKAIGVWSACSVVTTALGPVLGGVFARAGWWPGVFLINVPLAIAAIAILSLRAPVDNSDVTAGPVDRWGMVWSVCALAALNLGFIEGASRGFSDRIVLTALLLGSVSLLLFVVAESRTRNPILPLQFFRNRSLRVACLATLLFYSGLYGMTLFLSLNLIQLQKYDEVTAGTALLPIILSVIVLSPWAGRVVDRRGPRLLLTSGPGLAGIGYIGLAVPSLITGPNNYWVSFLPPLLLLGAAMGITAVPLTATVMNSLPPDRAGMASGLNSALSRLSNVSGVALLGCVALFAFNHTMVAKTHELPLSDTQRSELAREMASLGNARPPAGLLPAVQADVEHAIELSFVQAFRAVSYVCAAASWLAAILAACLLGNHRQGSAGYAAD
jgi:EmrB/QacA subfamily drug resistance transporter